MRLGLKLSLAGVSFLALSVPAFAQDAAGNPNSAGETVANKDEIVVTGTLIRGIAPAGTNSIAVSEEQVQETGATSVSQLLQTIPQFGSFNNLQAPSGGGNFVTTNRPDLRQLNSTTSGGSSTLMLVNGRRVVGMGISSTTPDADLVPPGIIERVEIIPDGGSAIYGADAVAGVINFITRTDINGVEGDARYGFADNYHTFDANLTAGKTWDGGGIYLSYNYSEHDAIYGRDRDWVRTFPAAASFGQAVTSIQCSPGNVNPLNLFAGLAPRPDVYGLPFTSATAATKRNVINQCDQSDGATVYPSEHRHAVFAGVNQQLNDSLHFDVSAFYTNREQRSSQGQYNGVNTVTAFPLTPLLSSSPYVLSHLVGTDLAQSVSWAFGPSDGLHQNISIEAWGIVPTFTYDIGSNWQARLTASYGESTSEQHSTALNVAALTNALPSGLFNPYDPAASDPTALAAITNQESFGRVRQRLFNTRLVLDGDLFQLPGGAVKLAAGAEYIDEGFIAQRGTTVPGFQNSGFPGHSINGTLIIAPQDRIPINHLSRDTKAAFAELVVPVFGQDNATGGFQELTLSASGRYDDYSDFGSTFNPKFGVTWRPIDWVKLRGSWGTSFAAPSLADNAAADPVAFNWATGPVVGFLAPTETLVGNGFPPPGPSQNTLIVLLGGNPDLQPQEATTWSLGADIDPPFIPGLRLSGTYYNISFDDLISQPPFTVPSEFFSIFRNSFIVNPSQDQIDAALAGSSFVVGSPCSPMPTCVYVLEDVRKANLGRRRLSGLDFAVNYVTETKFGSIDFNANATYELTRKQSATSTSQFIDILDDNRSRLKARSSIGVWIGDFRAQATWSYTQGYSLDPFVPAAGGFPVQKRVGDFNLFDLFFKYNVPGEGALKDLSFTLNVNNVFDQDPPVYRAQQIVASANGFAPGLGTVGRLIQFGVSKKF